MSNALIRTFPSLRSSRRRRRMRALLAMTALWTLLFAWALSSALSAIDASRPDRRASLLPIAAVDVRVAAANDTGVGDGAPEGVQISVDTEGALTDGHQASEAALYVAGH